MAAVTNNLNQRAAVEQIVRQVLAELRATAPAKTTSGSSPEAAHPACTLTTKVITVATLEGRLTPGVQLVVPRGAVFTPAARDELKRFNVTVASAVGNGKSSARPRLLLAAHGNYDVAPLAAGLAAENLDVVRPQAVGLPAIISLLAHELSNTRGLLITDQAAAAVALANRQAGVRAALVCNPVEIDRAASSLSPNLLVIDPLGRSVFELRQLVRHWLRHPEPVCPAALAPYLL
jgi:hypothetical protein